MVLETEETFDPMAGYSDTGEEDARVAEEKDVEKCYAEYKEARDFDEEARKQMAEDRAYASGRALKRWASEANIIGTFIDILVSFLYAKDPIPEARPATQVGSQPTELMADIAETLGLVIARLWKDARLKRKARKAVRSALGVGGGWLKILPNTEMRPSPVVKSRINELQDNIARLQMQQKQLAESTEEYGALEAQIAEMNRTMAGMQQNIEVVFRRGISIDFVAFEDMQTSLDVDDLGDYLDADWNANEIYLEYKTACAKFPRLTEKDLRDAQCYYRRKQKRRSQESDAVDAGVENFSYIKSDEGVGDKSQKKFLRVIEMWDRRDNHIKTFIEGVKKWAVEPYVPEIGTSRFYPYFMVAFYEVDGDRFPQSLPWRLKKLQDEYSSKRSNSRLNAERSVPGTIFDSTALSEQDARKIESAVTQEFVGIKPLKGDDVRKMFAEKPVGSADFRVFETESVLRDMERIGGVQEALSQSVTQNKTATEAEIQQSGFASRTGADRDTLEDTLTDMAQYTGEIAIQTLPVEYVNKLAGPLSVWPVGMAFEDITNLLAVDLVAGSSGKPNEQGERQAWTVLMPLIEKSMIAIRQAQAAGDAGLADAYKHLLIETARRMDDRISLDKLIPSGLPPMLTAPGVAPGGTPGADPNAPPGAAPSGPSQTPGP